MNRHEQRPVSDEELNAYIDDELDFEERNHIYEQLGQDEALTREAQELRQLRAMLRHAYRTPPSPPQRDKARHGWKGILNGIAAGLLLATGVLTGWYSNEHLVSPAKTDSLAFAHSVQLDASHAEQANVLLHISSADPQRMNAALSYAEHQLAEHKRQGDNRFRLEIVANDGGTELLRSDTSPFPERIETMLREYDNVSFLACANALRKLRERGIKVELLPGTRSDHTAIDEIINRLEGGWHYLKV